MTEKKTRKKTTIITQQKANKPPEKSCFLPQKIIASKAPPPQECSHDPKTTTTEKKIKTIKSNYMYIYRKTITNTLLCRFHGNMSARSSPSIAKHQLIGSLFICVFD